MLLYGLLPGPFILRYMCTLFDNSVPDHGELFWDLQREREQNPQRERRRIPKAHKNRIPNGNKITLGGRHYTELIGTFTTAPVVE